MLNGFITNQEIKFITSKDVELVYAPEVVKNRAEALEKEGVWKRFGEMTSLYNENTGEILFVQAMIKA